MASFWLGLLVATAFLMVSTWRFYSFKDLNVRNRHPFQLLIPICAFILLLVYFSRPLLFVLVMTYMFSGVMTRVASLFRRRPAQPAAAAYEEAPEPQTR